MHRQRLHIDFNCEIMCEIKYVVKKLRIIAIILYCDIFCMLFCVSESSYFVIMFECTFVFWSLCDYNKHMYTV